jgi:outer membrane protein OmpA-like peptidoglycan-associated protein
MNTRSLPFRSVTAVALLALASGCADMSQRQQGTAAGAGVGALAGAAVGSMTGGRPGQSAVIGAALGAVAGNLWSKNMEEKQRAMEQATAGTGVAVTRTADNQLKLDVPSDISFAVGSAAIEPRLRPVLDAFASGLGGQPRMIVRVVGHTDNTGSDAINEPLSLHRAESVRNYLEDRGIAANRIEVAGRGSREPIASNATAEGRAKNRRVEIFLREPQG